MMKFLKQFLLMAVVVIGLSMTAMAQRNDNQNRPPKNDPPKIDPSNKERPKPEKPPRGNENRNRPNRPQDAVSAVGVRAEISSV